MDTIFPNVSNISTSLYLPAVTHTQRIVVGAVLLVIAITGLIGNVLAIFVTKSIPHNGFIRILTRSLSVADFLTCVMVILQCVVIFSPDDVFPLPNWACAVVGGSSFIFVGCSVYTLAAIGLGSLVKFKWLFLTLTKRNGIMCLPAIWVVPMLINVVPHAIGVHQLGYNEIYHACGATHSHNGHPYFEMTQIVCMYVIPLIAMIVSYSWILVIFYRSSSRICSIPHTNTSIERYRLMRAVILCLLRIAAFIVFLTPYAICMFLPWLNPDLHGQLYAAIFVIANSCANPFVYVFNSSNSFKIIFVRSKALLKKWQHRNNVPEHSFPDSPASKRLIQVNLSYTSKF